MLMNALQVSNILKPLADRAVQLLALVASFQEATCLPGFSSIAALSYKALRVFRYRTRRRGGILTQAQRSSP
jgi:hypothetical protein